MPDKTKDENVATVMAKIGENARKAASALAAASASAKTNALVGAADAMNNSRAKILAANAIDMKNGSESGLSKPMLDRLFLDGARIDSIIESLRSIAKINDPVGSIIAEWDRPNGLHIERVRTPIGVIGVIFESRPNVTADAGALCLKSGNAVILRGGSDSYHSSRAIHQCLVAGLKTASLDENSIQVVPTTDRAAVGEMLQGLNGNMDVIVPRGGAGLVGRVQREARVPVFAHLEGLCHIYVDETSDIEMAVNIVTNSKMRRTGICGSAETLLVDCKAADTHLLPILTALQNSGCEIRGDETVQQVADKVIAATDKDWATEYLDAIISVKLVDGVEGAIKHIEKWSSHHTEAIISENAQSVEKFMNEVDSAILLHNASTQYADGGEFGMGAEIGIATGKMHARGPVGVEQLCSFKYRVRGTGQVRP